jgi:hypothetical protein
MKKLVAFIIAAQASVCVSGQVTSYGNFKVDEQELIYQKVYSADSISSSKLEEFYKKQPYILNLQSTSEGIQFDLNDINVDYKKFQYSQVNTPIILQTGKFSGKVSIGVKDGRYRVTVRSIQFTGNLGYKILTQKDNLTRYATKNSGTIVAEDWCKPNMFGLLDKAFNDKLEYKKSGEDW